MTIPDHISESFWVKILKFFNVDPVSRSGDLFDPGWKKFGSGIGDYHPDPQHWLTVLFHMYLELFFLKCSMILFASSFRTKNVHISF